MHIGHAIRILRIQRKLTQEQLALEADIATSNVSRIEKGQRQPSQRLLVKLATALNTTPSQLYAACEHPNLPDGQLCDTNKAGLTVQTSQLLLTSEAQILLKLFHELNSDNKALLLEQLKALHRWQRKE
ncbi:helix-turn-helix domain-containing protein [Rheinheimera sp. EpRS3]|uniref:helix-turn-helix domain-containing protein n=1 Tax=Rheinheimera sp. EpRS3 TaxID=1712383 RepID=UPI00074981F4|nr:helix-turn-helix domain-containing protein [Rheinheimera sp. EpRS3]KUM55196.1 XRE family transcriptional regulator [Rheinheimera sp. EpRS3]